MDSKHFAIVGGGIGGLTTAIALQRKGFSVTVYESAPEIKPIGAGLALAGNAVKALHDLGIAEAVVARGQKMKNLFIKDEKGKIISFTNAEEMSKKFGVLNNFTIHRADLHEVLIAHLSPGTLKLGHSLTDFQPHENSVELQFANGVSVSCDALVAADGIHSVVRKKLLPQVSLRYSGYTCWRGVVDVVPDLVNTHENIESWGSGRRFGIVPVGGNRVYWFATLNAAQQDIKMKSCKSSDLQEIFKTFHSPVSEIIKSTADQKIIWSDIIDIKPIHQFAFGRTVLIGDAAHATTPNMGQGACMAIEDAATLVHALLKYPVEEAFHQFEKHRLPRTTGIVNQSFQLGNLAQIENAAGRWLRDNLLRMVPQSTVENQLRKLLEVSFEC